MKTHFLWRKGLPFLSMAGALAASPVWALNDHAPPGEPARPERHDWRQLDDRLAILERVTVTGLVEVEAFHRNGYGATAAKEKEGNFLLATAALDFHYQLTDWAGAHALLLWEEGEGEAVEVDEAVITLGDPKRLPLFLNAGKMYVPFGVYSSVMIQDPLTLELGETNDTALQVGFAQAGFYGSVYGFRSEVPKAGRDHTLDNFGANIGYAVENEAWSLNTGLGWLRNLAATDTLVDALGEAGTTEIADRIAGLNAYLQASYGPVTFYAEYLTALDDFAAGELGAESGIVRPRAWHAELVYTRDLFEKATTFALGYQGTSQAADLALPEHRYLAAASVALADNLSWTVEYLRDRDYQEGKGGTGGKADMVTTQLAFTF